MMGNRFAKHDVKIKTNSPGSEWIIGIALLKFLRSE